MSTLIVLLFWFHVTHFLVRPSILHSYLNEMYVLFVFVEDSSAPFLITIQSLYSIYYKLQRTILFIRGGRSDHL